MSPSPRSAVASAGTILVATGLCLAAAAVLRIHQSVPATGLLPVDALAQLFSLHRILLRHFVILPLLPAVYGARLLLDATGRSIRPRPALARFSWGLLTLGACLVTWAFVTASLNDQWAIAVALPVSRDLVSPVLLVGLMASHAALLCAALVLLDIGRRVPLHRRSPTTTSLVIAAHLFVLHAVSAVAVTGTGLVERVFALGLFDPAKGGSPAGLAQLAAIAAAPGVAAVVLAILGIVTHAVAPGASGTAPRRTLWLLLATALFGTLSIDTRSAPATWTSQYVVVFWLMRVGFAAAVVSSIALVSAWAIERRTRPTGPAFFASSISVAFLVAEVLVDLFVSAPATAGLAGGYVVQARDYLLASSVVLAGIAAGEGWPPRTTTISAWPARTTLFGAALFTAGTATAIWPMLVMGLHGLSMEMRRFPPAFIPLQVLVLFGGAMLAVGGLMMLGSLLTRAIAGRLSSGTV